MMQSIRTYIILLCTALFGLCLSSCQRGEDEYTAQPEANLDALWQIIDQHYCFLDYKEQELGISWDEIHTRYRAKLNPQMSRAQLFEVLAQMLSELRDGHVNLSSSLDLGRNWSWREDYPDNLDRELRQQYLGTDCHVASGLSYRILDDNIGYVVYESFSSPIGNGNLSDMLFYLRLCDGLIIDVRGNTGGMLTYADRLASRFTNEKILVGYTQHKTGPGRNDLSRPEAEYLEPSDGIRWQKPVVVLTNRSCFSACNTFVRNMKECPLATIMGDQTGGGSGLPFSSELPIGWGVRFSACPSFDARMQQIEFGIQPDIPCSLSDERARQGEDSMIEAARALLRKE